MIPARLTRPTVGFMPTMPQVFAGLMIDPSVSVPTATAQRLALTDTADPELEPDGVRSSTYGFRHWRPRPLQPLDERLDRKLAHSERFALARITAPEARKRSTMDASRAAKLPSSASEPAVVCILSCVSMLSLTMTGMPWSGPRTLPRCRSASSASAIASASGFVSSTACSETSGFHAVLELGDRRFLEGEPLGRRRASSFGAGEHDASDGQGGELREFASREGIRR